MVYIHRFANVIALLKWRFGISYTIKFSLSVCLCVSDYVSMFVRNRLPNYANYGDEAFAGDSVGLGLGQRLNFIFN